MATKFWLATTFLIKIRIRLYYCIHIQMLHGCRHSWEIATWFLFKYCFVISASLYSCFEHAISCFAFCIDASVNHDSKLFYKKCMCVFLVVFDPAVFSILIDLKIIGLLHLTLSLFVLFLFTKGSYKSLIKIVFKSGVMEYF